MKIHDILIKSISNYNSITNDKVIKGCIICESTYNTIEIAKEIQDKLKDDDIMLLITCSQYIDICLHFYYMHSIFEIDIVKKNTFIDFINKKYNFIISPEIKSETKDKRFIQKLYYSIFNGSKGDIIYY